MTRPGGVCLPVNLTWQAVLYAVLSLTVIRMVPVALALAGRRLGRGAVAFVGWFGPRLAITAHGPDDAETQPLPARRLIRRAS
jgi:NhaP-type Na+/H+ or K+/H+ antiporter